MSGVPGFCAQCSKETGPFEKVPWACKPGHVWMCSPCGSKSEKTRQRKLKSVEPPLPQDPEHLAQEAKRHANFQKSTARSAKDRHPAAPMVEDNWRRTRILFPINTERDLVTLMKCGAKRLTWTSWS